jgi:protein dithiol:quinone oxidoreductase
MTARSLYASCALLCVGGLVVALVSQHVYGMQPCPWCVLQRLIFLTTALACALGLAWRGPSGHRAAAALGLLLACGGAAAALWQHFQAAKSASCNLTLADRIVSGWLRLDALLPDVFSARASCADAAVDLLGIPYDLWSLAAFVLVAVGMLRILTLPRHR